MDAVANRMLIMGDIGSGDGDVKVCKHRDGE